MKVSPLAGKPAPPRSWSTSPSCVTAYYAEHPDPAVAGERVAFGTSGHRGSSFDAHLQRGAHPGDHAGDLRVSRDAGDRRPLFMGMDTHALSEPALRSARSRCSPPTASRSMIDHDGGYTPTPVISHAILDYNRGRTTGLADGIVITPSHNPPEDGGFKYNPPNGGPADTDVTGWIENTRERAARARPARRPPHAATSAPARRRPRTCTTTRRRTSTISRASIDMDAIRGAGVRIGVDPLGGAGVHYWEPIIARYGIDGTWSTTASIRRSAS